MNFAAAMLLASVPLLIAGALILRLAPRIPRSSCESQRCSESASLLAAAPPARRGWPFPEVDR